jgi:hypothetical protein
MSHAHSATLLTHTRTNRGMRTDTHTYTQQRVRIRSRTPHIALWRCVNTHLGAREDDLARDKDEKDHLGHVHPVHDRGEQLGLVLAQPHSGPCAQRPSADGQSVWGRTDRRTAARARSYTAKLPVGHGQPLEPHGEANITAPNHVLNFKVFGTDSRKPAPLHDSGVLARGPVAVVLAPCAGHHHLARGKDERGRLGLADAQNQRRKSLSRVHESVSAHILTHSRTQTHTHVYMHTHTQTHTHTHTHRGARAHTRIRTLGWYSALRARPAMTLRSSRVPKLTVDTMLLAGRRSVGLSTRTVGRGKCVCGCAHPLRLCVLVCAYVCVGGAPAYVMRGVGLDARAPATACTSPPPRLTAAMMTQVTSSRTTQPLHALA